MAPLTSWWMCRGAMTKDKAAKKMKGEGVDDGGGVED